MSIEEKLKEYILSRYSSIREFTQVVDMSYSTVDSILKRGIGKSSISNIIKICKSLGISVDALADGEIVPIQARKGNDISNRFEVNDIIEDTKELLAQHGFVTLDGKPINKDCIDSIIDAMDVGVEMAKKKMK